MTFLVIFILYHRVLKGIYDEALCVLYWLLKNPWILEAKFESTLHLKMAWIQSLG